MTMTQIVEVIHEKPELEETSRRRAAGAVLIAGSLIFFLAEAIAAAAWTKPPYSYSYNDISALGVHGPVKLAGQLMYSPLAPVMNVGFVLFGLTLFVGIVMLRGLRARHRWAVIVPAAFLAIGGVLTGLFPFSPPVPLLHLVGGLLATVGGNILAINVGRLYRLIGVSRTAGRAIVVLGIFGLVSLVVYNVVVGTNANPLAGLLERCADYPSLIALILAGASIWSRRSPDSLVVPSR
jgi:Protein of unknown function (DUF998)